MLIVKVELHSAITGRVTELARMLIANKGDVADPKIGNYGVTTLRGRNAAAFAKPIPQRVGEVLGHRRLDLHVWHLVAKALAALKYGEWDDSQILGGSKAKSRRKRDRISPQFLPEVGGSRPHDAG